MMWLLLSEIGLLATSLIILAGDPGDLERWADKFGLPVVVAGILGYILYKILFLLATQMVESMKKRDVAIDETSKANTETAKASTETAKVASETSKNMQAQTAILSAQSESIKGLAQIQMDAQKQHIKDANDDRDAFTKRQNVTEEAIQKQTRELVMAITNSCKAKCPSAEDCANFVPKKKES
jgi:hypothetical protein